MKIFFIWFGQFIVAYLMMYGFFLPFLLKRSLHEEYSFKNGFMNPIALSNSLKKDKVFYYIFVFLILIFAFAITIGTLYVYDHKIL